MSLGLDFPDYVENLRFKADLPTLPTNLPEKIALQAATHTSLYGAPVRQFETSEASQDFQKLELLGDTIIASSTVMLLESMFPLLTIGAATAIKSTVVANKTLAAVCRAYSLQTKLRAAVAQAPLLRKTESVQAALTEALVGAIYVHAGSDTAATFAREMMRPLAVKAYDSMKAHKHPAAPTSSYAGSVASQAMASSSDSGYGGVDVGSDDGEDDDYGPEDVQILEMWRMEKRTVGRDVKYIPGDSTGPPNLPQHSASVTYTLDGVARTIGPFVGHPGDKAAVVKQRFAHAVNKKLGLV